MYLWKTQRVTLRKFSSVQKVCRVNNGWNTGARASAEVTPLLSSEFHHSVPDGISTMTS